MVALSTATKTNPIMDAAIEYANRGWPVFPCNPSTKQPYTAKGFNDSSTDVNQICDWWTRHPSAMIGVPTGAASGFWALDIDVKPDANGATALAKLEATNGILPTTPMVSTPSCGTHYYFKHQDGVKNRGGLEPGIDVRGEGGYVIAPGSVKDDGTYYAWQCESELAIAPAWLLALVIRAPLTTTQTKTGASGSNPVYSEAAINSELQKLIGSFSNRNNQLNDSAYAIGQFVGAGEISRGDAETRLFGAATANGYVGKDGGTSARATIRSGLDAGQREPRKIPEPTVRLVAANDNEKDADTKPVNLWAKVKPPSLTLGMLPGVIERYAVAQGRLTGADLSGIAASALAVCAAAIPDSNKLQVKRHTKSWRESARLWFALIGGPSVKKSPIIDAAVYPLQKIDAEYSKENSEALKTYNKLSPEEKKQTDAPKSRRVFLQNATVEAVQEVLKDNHEGLLYHHDELAAFFGSMDKYNGGKGASVDRAFFLTSYGGGSYTVDRISRGNIFIPNLSICVLGGIQPDVIRGIASECADDGLIQRFLPIVLQDSIVGKDEPLSDDALEYNKLVRTLHKMSGGVTLEFDDGAQKLRLELEQKHKDLEKCWAANGKLTTHIGKYDGIFARLCVLFHSIDHADGELPTRITEKTAQRVAAFLHGFLLPHAEAFYTDVLGLADNHDDVQNVANYILTHPEIKNLTHRVIGKGNRAMRRLERYEVDNVLDRLYSFGWVNQAADIRPGRRTDTIWPVNPRARSDFAEQAVIANEQLALNRELLSERLAAHSPTSG
jgi:hypothetical protein